MSFERDIIPPPIPEANRHQRADAFDTYVLHSGLGSRLITPEDRLRFVEQLSGASFLQLLFDLNGVITDQPASPDLLCKDFQVTTPSPDDPTTPFDVMPAPEDKTRLLKSILFAAKTTEREELKPLTLATGILAIHPFPDGNGRVARGLYHLLTHDYTPGSPELYATLQKDGDTAVPFEMHLPGQMLFPLLRQQLGTHVAVPGTRGGLRPLFMPAIKDRSRDLIGYRPANRQPNFGNESSLFSVMVKDRYLPEMIPALLVRNYPHSEAVRRSIGGDGQQHHFAVDEFLVTATGEDAQAVYDIYKSVTRQYIQTLGRTVAGLENQHLRALIYVNEGNGTAIGDLPTLLYALAEKRVTPNTAMNESLQAQS